LCLSIPQLAVSKKRRYEKMGMNRACIGKTYSENTLEITAKDSVFYASSYNDDNPWFFEESRSGGIICPPMFGVVYGGMSVAGPLFDKELEMNVAMMVHGEQEMVWYDIVKPGDRIKSQARIADIVDLGKHEICYITVECTNQAGKKVLDSTYGFLVRGGGSGGKAPARPELARKEEVFKAEMDVSVEQTYRYAFASGDHNPIHVNPDFAKKVGLPGIILQGLCSMAFTSKAVMDGYLDRDPTRLKKLSVRFSAPVLPKDHIVTTGWMSEKGPDKTTLCFETAKQDGSMVIKNGVAEVV
jgi:acyl dehydratase